MHRNVIGFKILFCILFLALSCTACSIPTKRGKQRGKEYIKWVSSLNGRILSAGFSNVSGNSIPEVVVTSTGEGDDFTTYILNGESGEILKEVTRIVEAGVPTGEPRYFGPSPLNLVYQEMFLPFIDVNGDGKDELFTLDDFHKEIIEGSENFSVHTYALSAIDGGGIPLWSYKMDPSEEGFQPLAFNFPLLMAGGNTSGDGSYNIIVSLLGKRVNSICVLSGDQGTLKWCKGGTLPLEIGSVFDINNDGAEDIVVFHRLKTFDQHNGIVAYPGVIALDGRGGSVLWEREINCDKINLSSRLSDIVVICESPPLLYVLNSKDGELGYSFDLKSESGNLIRDIIRSDAIALGDVDGDGMKDIILEKEEVGENIFEKYLFAFNVERGTSLWKYPNMPGEMLSFLIADVDGDGKNEVISNYTDRDSNSNFELQVINGEDGTPVFWYGDFQGLTEYSSIKNLRLWGTGDVDGDGAIDLLTTGTGCKADSTCYPVVVLLRTDAPLPSDLSLLPWPLPRHDKYQSNTL